MKIKDKAFFIKKKLLSLLTTVLRYLKEIRKPNLKGN